MGQGLEAFIFLVITLFSSIALIMYWIEMNEPIGDLWRKKLEKQRRWWEK